MPTQLVPDGIEVTFNAVQNGVPIVNVYHCRDTGLIDGARLMQYCNEFYDWWFADLRVIQSNSYVLQSIVATNMETGAGPQAILALATGNQGALTGTQEAGNAALVMSWRTSSIGRSYRGRTYLGGLDSAAILTAQSVTTSFQAAVAAAGVDLIDRIGDLGGTLVVLSRYLAGALRVVGLLTDIVSIIVDQKIDSQRKRTAN